MPADLPPFPPPPTEEPADLGSEWIGEEDGDGAARGWSWLAALTAQIPAADTADRAGRVAALVAAIAGAHGAVLRDLGAARREDAPRVGGALVAVGAVRGLGDPVRQLVRAVREEAERQEDAERQERQRVTHPPGGGALTHTLRASLRGYALPRGLVAPPGYEVDCDGVRRILPAEEDGEERIVLVARRPLAIVGRCRDVTGGGVSVVLAWSTVAGWVQHTVGRAVVADSRAVVALAALDAPVYSGSAREVVAYCAAFEAANSELPEARVSPVMGWVGAADALSFLWGRKQVTAAGVEDVGAVEEVSPASWRPGQVHLLPGDPGLRAAVAGFRSAGTLDGWIAGVAPLTAYPRVMLGIFAAMVPPLMRFLPTLANFVVDYCGSTSTGKTTALRAAASVWGCPDERASESVMHSWDATPVFVERIASLSNYLPVLLDETKKAKKREEVARVVYNFASGVGRGRGSVTSVQATTRTHGVLITTGEEPITAFTGDGGTRARALCLWGLPFGETTETTAGVAGALTGPILANYGHLGPALVEQLAADPAKREDVTRAYAAELAHWTARAGANSVAGRLAAYVAALAVAEALFYALTGLEQGPPAMGLAWDAALAGAAESDRATEALRQVLSWATSQQARFHGRMEGEDAASAPTGGWLGAWLRGDGWRFLAILPSELMGVLDRAKFDATAVIRTWDDRGWLARDGANLARKVTVGERRERCYCITRAAADGVDVA